MNLFETTPLRCCTDFGACALLTLKQKQKRNNGMKDKDVFDAVSSLKDVLSGGKYNAVKGEADSKTECFGADAPGKAGRKMTLAEALNERADIQKKISQLSARLKDNAKVQEGDEPAEKPAALIGLLNKNIDALEELMRRINRTNAATEDGSETLTGLIARRDALTLKNSVLRSFLAEASQRTARYSNSEIKIVSTVNVSQMQKTVDKNAQELRELNARIQKLNWATELL